MADLPRILIICPSLDKPCGIARYSGYVVDSLKSIGFDVELLKSSDEAIVAWEANRRKTIVLVEHEYGLFDSFSDLGIGETTSDMLANLSFMRNHADFDGTIAIIMHTLVLQDHVLNAINKQIFSSGFPVFNLNSEGAKSAQINFLEHGVYQTGKIVPPPLFATVEDFRVGAFGLLSPNKDLSSLFHLCEQTGAQLHANFACFDESLKQRHSNEFHLRGLRGCLQFEFLSEADLATFLGGSNVIYLPQHDIPHYATSGSARFALGIGRPVLVPAHRPFHDLVSCVGFGDLGGAISAVKEFVRDPNVYKASVQTVTDFVSSFPVSRVYKSLINQLINHNYVIGGHIPDLNSLCFVDVETMVDTNLEFGSQIDRLLSRRYRFAEKAVRNTGQMPVGGKLWQSLVGWENENRHGESHDGSDRAFSLIPAGEPSSTRDISRAAGALLPVVDLNEAWLKVVAQKKSRSIAALDSLIADYSGQNNFKLGSATLLRLFGLDYGSFPFLEFIDFPLIVQVHFLRREKLLSDEQIEALCQVLLDAQPENERGLPSQDIASFVMVLSAYRKLPFWGRIGVRLRWSERLSFEIGRRDPVRHPAGVLIEDPKRFVIGAYLTMLGRLPDPQGFDAYISHLNKGMRRSQIISAFSLSAEYRSSGAAWLYGDNALLEGWDSKSPTILSMFSVLCPDQAKSDLKNYRYWDAVQMDRITERLERAFK